MPGATNNSSPGPKPTEAEKARILRMTHALASGGHWRFDIATRTTYWSPEIFGIQGWNPELAVPSDELSLRCVHPGDLDRFVQCIDRAIETGLGYEIKWRMIRRGDSAERIIRSKIEVETGSDGAPIALVGVCQDATEYENALRRARESEAYFRALTEESPDMIMRLKPDTTITYVSPGCRNLGYEPGEIVGRPALEFIHPDDRDDSARLFMLNFSDKRPDPSVRCEHHIRAKNGAYVWMEGNPFVIRDESGAIVEVINSLRDMTRRRKLEEELRLARDDAMRAAKEKTTFLAAVTHEIRNPLNGILGLSGALASSALSAEDREIVDLIQSSGEMLDRMLADLLALSKAEASSTNLDIAPFDMPAAIEAAVYAMKKRAAQKGIGFHVSFEPRALGRFLGDETRIKQIVGNLASNAVKFTQAGEVRVEVALAEAADGGQTPDAIICVSDTGAGFNQAQAAKLFKPFKQLGRADDPRADGTGLGLAICHALVKAMGGLIDVHSMSGHGSRFSVRLPLQRAPVQSAPPPAANEAKPAMGMHLKGRKILLAEDHPTNQKVVELILKPFGAALRIVGNGQEALDAFGLETFDLVLMDMQMPVMDGIEAVKRIRTREAEGRLAATPVIMLTAHGTEDDRILTAAAGADSHIVKPVSPRSLIGGIEEALRAGAGQGGHSTARV
jgi:PAS domain S-box-containing protein